MDLSNGKDFNLESLSTIQKILLLQDFLKKMTSIKERFNDNKNKLLGKLDSNCYTYFKSKVYLKKIFNYCISLNPEQNKEYVVIENPKKYLKELYQSLYDFYFLIRNENSLMLKIIEFSDKLTYEDLSDFFVNFLYENIINSSFVNDELILMFYLLLEQLILKIFPEKFDINKNLQISFLKDSFIFYAFKALTRKIDLRNFLYTIFNDFIEKMANFTLPLSVDLNIVNRYVRIKERKRYHHSFIKNMGSLTEEDVKRNKKKFRKINQKDNLFKTNNSGNMFLKRTKKIVLGNSGIFINDKDEKLMNLEEKLSQTHSLKEDTINKPQLSKEIEDDKKVKFTKRKTHNNDKVKKEDDIISNINEGINSILVLEKNKSEQKSNETEKNKNIKLNLAKNKSEKSEGNEIEDDLDENGKIKINIFFEDSSLTIKKIKGILSKYEKNKELKNSINNAMKEYLNILISIDSSEKIKDSDKEIFSNSIIIEELENTRKIKQSDSFRGLMRRIRFNHRIITKIIIDIIKKLKENLISSPYTLKCIIKMIDILLTKKYNDLAKNKLSNYQLFMFKINFLIGNIIIPIIKNPYFNGITTINVISDITKDNLKMISNIFEKMIGGNLFNKNKDPYMTIFNKFIIETMPILFELVENLIEGHFELPIRINNLINNFSKNNKDERIINYMFFKENPNENINYQSLCFSWKNTYILLQLIEKYKKVFIDDNKNNEQKLILTKFLEKKDGYISLFTKGLKEKIDEFFYFTKASYNDDFYNKIKSIIQDNFIYVIPKLNNDLITAFKKCIVEVLNYANNIQEECFYDLTERKDVKTFKPKHYKKMKKEEEEEEKNDKTQNIKKKNKFITSLKSSLIKIALGDKNDDADFKNILFPQIRKNLNMEINYNVDSEQVQRIIFCTNYIHLYIRNIPEKYKKNNYSLLFDELITDIKNNIEFLKTNALFEYYKKLKEAKKSNIMNSNFQEQIQNLEKLKCIEYLYNKLLLQTKFKIERDQRNIISNIEYQKEQNTNNNLNNNDLDVIDYFSSQNQPIKNMIDTFPDFHEYEEEYDNILDIEEKANVPDALNEFFSVMKNLIKKEKIIKRFNKDELENLIYDLENYILTKMYDKLFPFESTNEDNFFYQKCKRLGFIKPENIVSDKRVINEKLWEQAIEILDNLDDKLTPIDKIKCIAKAFEILQNSINFTSGKDELGVDDVINPLIYIIIKAKPQNMCSNYQYCELYLNSELSKKQYGVILSQIGLVINIIKKMKYNDLIGVSEEQFGKDEEIEEDNENE